MPGLTIQKKGRRAKRPAPEEIEAGPLRKHSRKARGFDEQCMALVVYKAEHGHINVPSQYTKDPALSAWVARTRSSQGTKLTPQQKAKLRDLGFDWETKKQKNEKRWDAMLEKLQEYRKVHLDCCVPKRWPSDPQLATWVKNQREKEANKKLQPHHKQHLDAIKFQWSQRTTVQRDSSTEDAKWFEKYQMLVEYREENGNCLVPDRKIKGAPGAELARWVNWQRQAYQNGKLQSERKKWLDEIDFVYKMDKADPNASRTQKRWNEMCQHLVEFKEENGHVDVKRSDTKWGLGTWVKAQRDAARKGKIDQRRAMRLQEIGITWGKDLDERWEEGFVMLDKYQKTFGHFRVPACYGSNRSRGKQENNRNLFDWVRKQRAYQAKGTLLPERKERLDAVGFPWKTVKSSRAVECPSSDDEEETSSTSESRRCDTVTSRASRLRLTQKSNVVATTTDTKPQSYATLTATNECSDDSDSEFEFEG